MHRTIAREYALERFYTREEAPILTGGSSGWHEYASGFSSSDDAYAWLEELLEREPGRHIRRHYRVVSSYRD